MRGSERGRRDPSAGGLATIRGVLWLQLVANGAGAAVVFVYLRFLFPVRGADDTRQLGINLLAFAAYLGVVVFVALPVNAVLLARGMRWVREGRPPTPTERWNALTQPLQQTTSAFLGWIGAAIIFGILNQDAQRVSVGIALAGLVTCSLLYLLLERHFRPIFALALEGADLPKARREIVPTIMMSWMLGSAVPIIGLGLAPLGVPPDQRGDLSARIAILVVTSVVAGGLVMRAAARSVAEPIEEVRDALGKVEDGDLDTSVSVDHAGEIGRLQSGFNDMVEGLRERRKLHDLYGRQVGADVARHSLEQGVAMGGESREVTVLFVDLAGFTAFTERHDPERVVAELNAFFEIVVRVVLAEGGSVNKFEGDAALCVFGAPDDQPDHATRALRAAARLPREVASLPDAPRVGIGVATGHVVAGHVGTPERFEYTVIGDAVNIAARLTELAKERGAPVLADDQTVTAARRAGTDGWSAAGSVHLRGRRAETALYTPPAMA